jgi:predicted amidohydrolase
MFSPHVVLALLLAALGIGRVAAQEAPSSNDGFVLAALSLTPEPWDKEANFQKLAKFARQAAAQGAQVIVAPEGYLEGYVGNEHRTPGLTQARYAAEAAEELDGPLLRRIRSLADELNVFLMLGFAEKRAGQVFNTAVMFAPDGSVAAHYSKSHTMNDEPFNTKGDMFPVVTTPFGQWGTLICFDRQVPEAARILALKGADTIFVPAWGGYGEMNDQMMRVRAYENGVNVAFVHPKRALLIDSSGAIIAQNEREGDQVVLGRMRVNPKRKHSMLQYRRPELYRELSQPIADRP